MPTSADPFDIENVLPGTVGPTRSELSANMRRNLRVRLVGLACVSVRNPLLHTAWLRSLMRDLEPCAAFGGPHASGRGRKINKHKKAAT
jgi:hypothetical protein